MTERTMIYLFLCSWGAMVFQAVWYGNKVRKLEASVNMMLKLGATHWQMTALVTKIGNSTREELHEQIRRLDQMVEEQGRSAVGGDATAA